MAQKRGTALTVFALLFVLLAISDFAKPLLQSPTVGLVFLGVRQSGSANAILGPLFGICLLIYAYGIWTMRRYALPVAYIFTGWVVINTVLYSMKNSHLSDRPSLPIAVIETAIGIGVPLATALLLSRRQNDLSG
jgi:hypothetical protein